MNILVASAAVFVGRNLVENLKNIRDGKNLAQKQILSLTMQVYKKIRILEMA